ncbi:MAG: tetratricopeptide repeat protein [Agathobacter sp.]
MICYKCNHEAGKEDVCPSCGADLSVFQKVIRLSNMYYNDGLQKAEVRNLSGAIISLKKSLKFYKYNIDARNLLGLVYYEMGETVDALSEWVISKSYQEEDNIAGRYLDEIRQNRAQLQANNQTIKKYNQALLYCRQDSRDLAIIQLKKVISLNPKLVKAHQLLALLYMQEDKLDLAKKALRSAGKIDANNTITLRYLKEVNARMKENSNGKKRKDDDLISYQSGNETIIMPKRFQDSSVGFNLTYLLIGLVVGALVIGFLVIPEVEKRAQEEWRQKLVEINETISAKDTTIEGLEQDIRNLQEELRVALLPKEDETLPEQLLAYDMLLSAFVAYATEDYILAGTNLNKVDVNLLTDSAKAMHTTLWTEIADDYYNTLYDTGYASYEANDYADTIQKLQEVVNYNIDFKEGNSAYYLAQAYRKNGDLESARQYYQYVIDHYPGTKRAETAAKYVNAEA